MEYTSLHFEGTDDDNDNDDDDDDENDDDGGGTNGTRTASTSSRVPPNNSQKLKRDKAADNLISWNGPLVVTDNETVVLTLSKAGSILLTTRNRVRVRNIPYRRDAKRVRVLEHPSRIVPTRRAYEYDIVRLYGTSIHRVQQLCTSTGTFIHFLH
mmetsp:Transcript_18428/g.38724  ORF Transcript_18428/g.38724 Transcript_18428/m.38724 type:complete len:155 (-) Transcript_18428:25-489(-)